MKSKRKEWISPNNKYKVIGHKFNDQKFASVYVKITGRRSPIKYLKFTIKKSPFPKYVIDQCERIKYILEN